MKWIVNIISMDNYREMLISLAELKKIKIKKKILTKPVFWSHIYWSKKCSFVSFFQKWSRQTEWIWNPRLNSRLVNRLMAHVRIIISSTIFVFLPIIIKPTYKSKKNYANFGRRKKRLKKRICKRDCTLWHLFSYPCTSIIQW